jgi:hypothetical protein
MPKAPQRSEMQVSKEKNHTHDRQCSNRSADNHRESVWGLSLTWGRLIRLSALHQGQPKKWSAAETRYEPDDLVPCRRGESNVANF